MSWELYGNQVPFSTEINLAQGLVIMPAQAISAALVFSLSGSARSGCECRVNLTADGNSSHVPDFTAFTQHGGSDWSNTNGVVNHVRLWADGTNKYYAITTVGSSAFPGLAVSGNSLALNGVIQAGVIASSSLAALNASNPASGYTAGAKLAYTPDTGLLITDGAAWQAVGVGTLYDPAGVTPPNPPDSVGAAIATLLNSILTIQGTAQQITMVAAGLPATLTFSIPNAFVAPGSITATGQLIGGGTATSDDAAAGQIGEMMTSGALPGTGTSLTSTTPANGAVTTALVLTPGDWDVEGHVLFNGTATTISYFIAGLSSASATIPNDIYRNNMGLSRSAALNAVGMTLMMPPRRVTVAAATTSQIYPAVQASFSSGTMTAAAYMRARRMR